MTNKVAFHLLLIILSFLISSCQQSLHNKSTIYKRLSRDDIGNVKYRGHYKANAIYKIRGKSYNTQEVKRYNKVGIASWYGERHGFHGKETANGDIYNKNLLTAAHKTLPLPSLVKVTNLENKRSIIVLVNDRGPFVNNRIIDLSERAAVILGMKKKGLAKVRVKYLYDESNSFLKTLGLKRRLGSCAEQALPNPECTVNCYIKLINLQYKNPKLYNLLK